VSASIVVVLGLVIFAAAMIAIAMIRRDRRRAITARALQVAASPVAAVTATPAAPPRARPRPAVARGGGGGGLAIATASRVSSSRVCPTCRTEYDGLTYCTRDARRLVAPEEMLAGARSAGLVCMACRRAYEPGLRRCPHDGNELLPFPVYSATRPRRGRATEPAGVIARICPVCGAKYDLNARFCGHDAGELIVIN
jgi:hypothetical protein